MLAVGKGIGGSKAFLRYGWDNLSLQDAWVDQGASYVVVEGMSAEKRPDITTWNGANFVLSDKAYTALKESLAPYGEFLPLTIDGESSFVFNCMRLVEAEKSCSEPDIVDGLWLGVKSIGFSSESIEGNLIFKSKFDRCSSIYCGDSFKALIESSELDGLMFVEDLVEGF